MVQLMGYLVRQGLFPSLSQILIAVTPEVPPQASALATNRPPPAAEALVVNLTARCLTYMRQPSLAGVEQQLPYLLCVPLLWSRWVGKGLIFWVLYSWRSIEGVGFEHLLPYLLSYPCSGPDGLDRGLAF